MWHCDAKGRYSLYDRTIPTQNYLRGLQVADEKGQVQFRSIFPAAYSGRWPHIHFEVYESREAAAKRQGKIRTSQIALPEKACHDVYATSYYALSRPNLAQMTLETDGVFADGARSSDGRGHRLGQDGPADRPHHQGLTTENSQRAHGPFTRSVRRLSS